MSTSYIPNNGEIRTNYNTDKYTELWDTFGVDLQSVGKIKSSKKLLKVKDSSDDGNFGNVVGIETYSSQHYTVTDEEIYKCSVLNDVTDESNWSKENTNGVFGAETDTVVFGGNLLVSQETDILSFNGTTWDEDWWTTVTSGSALTNNRSHAMEVLNGGQETLFVTDDNVVRYYNITAGHSTVTIKSGHVASTLSAGRDSMWVGTYSDSDKTALVYEIYVGEQLNSVAVARYAHKVDGRAVLVLEVVDGTPYVLTDKGHWQMFNGVGFVTVKSLPFAFTPESLEGIRTGSIQNNSWNRPVSHGGSGVHNQSIYCLMNTEMYNEDKTPNRTATGLWEFNTTTRQLNHRSPLVENTTQKGFVIGEKSGPLLVINTSESLFLAGFELNGEANGLFAETTTNYGYIVTGEIESNTVQDALESQYIKAKTLTGDDSIQLKYRVTEQDRQVVSGTWADTSTINTTDTVTVSVGDEVTLMNGTKAGFSAQVSSLSIGGATTSITLDTEIGTLAETNLIEVTNFTKVKDTYTSSDGEYKRLGVDATTPWVQYKLTFDGEVSLRQFINKGNSKTEL